MTFILRLAFTLVAIGRRSEGLLPKRETSMKLKLSPTNIAWIFSLLASFLSLSSPVVADAPVSRLCSRTAVLGMPKSAVAQESACSIAMGH